MLSLWLLPSFSETIEIPQHETEHPVLVRVVRKGRHFLLDSLCHFNELGPDLLQSHRGIVGWLLGGRRSSRPRFLARIVPQTLGHFRNVIYGPLGDAEPERPEVEHPHTPVVVRLPVVRRRRLSTLGLPVRLSLGLWLAILAAGEIEPQPEYHGITIRRLLVPLIGNRTPAGWAHLLALQPALEASEVENVATGKLLGARALDLACVRSVPDMHLFSANDAGVLALEVLRRRVWVLVHILEGLTVTDEGIESLQTGPGGHEPISNDVDGEAEECEEDAKEGRVDAELDDV
jgi:hypothetical protein